MNQSEMIRVLHANGGTKQICRQYLKDFWMAFAHPKLANYGAKVDDNFQLDKSMRKRFILRDAHLAQFIKEENYEQLKRDAEANFFNRAHFIRQ